LLICQILAALETDAVLANAAWHELGKPLESRTDSRCASTRIGDRILGAVGNDVLQHGVGLLVWQHFIDARFAAMCSLIEKVRKTPKGRQTRKELGGVSETSLVRFATCCEALLRLMLDANADCKACIPTHVQAVHEDLVDALLRIWRRVSGRIAAGGIAESPTAPHQQSLTERAARLKCTNFHLIHHRWQLGVVVRLMLEVRGILFACCTVDVPGTSGFPGASRGKPFEMRPNCHFYPTFGTQISSLRGGLMAGKPVWPYAPAHYRVYFTYCVQYVPLYISQHAAIYCVQYGPLCCHPYFACGISLF
jgi:hypothetical protein